MTTKQYITPQEAADYLVDNQQTVYLGDVVSGYPDYRPHLFVTSGVVMSSIAPIYGHPLVLSSSKQDIINYLEDLNNYVVNSTYGSIDITQMYIEV